ncbi:MAG: TadE/TadG family type IV pilus assembly protein [Sphaerobacter sp.]|nr:TadE/TadG family type IV pilus assembly protein [Sphaerobacter sp.]
MSKRRAVRARRRLRGQSLVELAIALPLLLLLLLGTIDLGRMFVDYVQMRNAAFRGARYGATAPDDTAGIRDQVRSHGVPADTVVTVTCDPVACGAVVPGTPATITVSAARTFTPVTVGFLQRFFGLGPVNLKAHATVRVAT